MLEFKWNESIAKLVKQRNIFLVILLGMLVTNILTAVLLFTKNERIIIVPSYFKQSFWNQGEIVSESYIEEMTLFFSKLMLDTTPSSHKYRRDVILRYVMPENYHVLDKKLIEEEERLSRDAVVTSFVPKEIKVNSKKLTSEITGTSIRYVAGLKAGQVKETYRLEFGYSGGIFMLKNFKTKQVE